MQEYKITKILESFKQAGPQNEWASFAKESILAKSFEPEKRTSLGEAFKFVFNQPKLAMVSSFVICFVVLTFIISTNVYNANSQWTNNTKPLTPEEKLLAAIQSTDLELSKISNVANTNGEVDIKEVKEGAKRMLASASEQLKDLPDKQKVAFAGTVVAKVKALEKNNNTVIMDEDKTAIQEFYKVIAEDRIKEIESNIKNLTDKQKVNLSKAKDFFAVGKYGEVLEELALILPSVPSDSSGPERDK